MSSNELGTKRKKQDFFFKKEKKKKLDVVAEYHSI
jgi:hypothetical protein